MLKATLKTPVVTFQLEAEKPKDLFKALAEVQEVFGEAKCGLCGKSDLKFVVRTVEGNDYHELACNSCFAKLSFGASKQKPGHLFPIRKLTKEGKASRKDGEYGKHNGWSVYKGKPEVAAAE